MKQKYVSDFQSGESVSDAFLVFERDFRQARNGSHYITLVLGDRTGRVNARVWDARRDQYDLIAQSNFLTVRGHVETYKSQLQLIVKSASPCDPASVDLADFLHAPNGRHERCSRSFLTFLGL